MAGIEEGLADATSSAIGFTPKILAAVVVLVIGLIIGRIVGRVVARILETAKVNKVIEETPLGDMISHSGMNMLEFLDALARWFIYLIFIMAAVNILDIELFSQFLERTVDYLPSFIAGIIILIIGLAIADFSVNWLKSIIKSMNLKGGEHLEAGIRVFLFLVIVLLALDQMRVDTSIIRLFLGPFAWALAVILIFRWGVSESLTVYAKAKK
jgi:xanthine/uracil permease